MFEYFAMLGVRVLIGLFWATLFGVVVAGVVCAKIST